METDDLDARTDAELVDAVRGGDLDAYGSLFARHRDVAGRVAHRAAGPTDADEVVAEVFAAVLSRLRAGGGPTVSFRAYVLTAVRHEAARCRATRARCVPTDDIERVGPTGAVPGPDDPPDGLREAYVALPERWRRVLWELEVEGRSPQELAPGLGLSPNAVAALGYRARVGLRAAYATCAARAGAA